MTISENILEGNLAKLKKNSVEQLLNFHDDQYRNVFLYAARHSKSEALLSHIATIIKKRKKIKI